MNDLQSNQFIVLLIHTKHEVKAGISTLSLNKMQHAKNHRLPTNKWRTSMTDRHERSKSQEKRVKLESESDNRKKEGGRMNGSDLGETTTDCRKIFSTKSFLTISNKITFCRLSCSPSTQRSYKVWLVLTRWGWTLLWQFLPFPCCRRESNT